MWQMRFYERLRFEYRSQAIAHRDMNGLAWSHFVQWDGRGFRVYPHMDRLNAWQRSHYKVN